MLAAAFTSAATRRFGEKPPSADVIGFVAEARASNPAAAGILTTVLFALTRENEAPAAAIDVLLPEAASQAPDHFQRRAGR